VPVAVKNETDVEGYRTYHGCKPDEELFEVKKESAWPVKKWVEEGAVCIGVLNMHEAGAGMSHHLPYRIITPS
jgi:Asp-tRNA(Asn)/Glu-tRNA(Gln) amidotransferase A subunit family amidase